MDLLYALHLLFVVFFLSIPFWSKSYLIYGLYAPILLSTIWIIFDGCPLTRVQYNLNDEYFSRVLLEKFIPNVTKETASRVSYYILLAVTLIAAIRLCPKLMLNGNMVGGMPGFRKFLLVFPFF